MLKTVYRSSFRDKHNCQWRDSNLDPLTLLSDALTTRLLRPESMRKRCGKVASMQKDNTKDTARDSRSI